LAAGRHDPRSGKIWTGEDHIQGDQHCPNIATAQVGQAKVELGIADVHAIGACQRLACRRIDRVDLPALQVHAHLVVGSGRVAQSHDDIIRAVGKIHGEGGILRVIEISRQLIANAAVDAVHRAQLPAVAVGRTVSMVRRMARVIRRHRGGRCTKVEPSYRVRQGEAAQESILGRFSANPVVVLVEQVAKAICYVG
jgi:hypothetical protein